MVIGPVGPAVESSMSVPPPWTSVARVLPVVATLVLPTTVVVVPDPTLIVEVTGGGLGPTVCASASEAQEMIAAGAPPSIDVARSADLVERDK
jgi:hypothetical protein